MPAPKRPPSSASDRLIGVLAFTAGSAWYAELMRPAWTAHALGPICGHAAGPGPHCAPCYATLALMGVGLALVAASARRLKPATIRKR